MKPHIGFIGLGAMGAPMAKRLLEAGYEITSSINRNREPIEALLPFGIQEARTPNEVGAVSDILMLVVWDELQIDQVLRGEKGALSTLKPGSKIFLMSTISPEYCRAMSTELASKDIAVLDCPLSGLPQGAEAGTLSLMIGGNSDVIDACREPLEILGTIYHCGDVGAGQAVKLGNNAMVIGTLGLLLEVRDMINSQGVDFDTFKSVLNNSTGRSFVSESMTLPPLSTIPHPMAQKDVSKMLEAAGNNSAPMLKTCFEYTLEGKQE